MNGRKIAPYATWKSPITAEMISSSKVKFTGVCLDGEDTYWVEMRPDEAGRNVIVRRQTDGTTEEVNPKPFNARSTVHEYGGGAFTVADGVVFFSNYKDQRIYLQKPGEEPVSITARANMRYADMILDADRRRLICVCEDHSGDGEAINSIIAIDLEDVGAEAVLVSGSDFYASPRLNAHGDKIAWLTWNHPNMPWDGTELWVASISPDGKLYDSMQIAGGARESVFQPEWSPEGELYFVSDRSQWWNLYRHRAGKNEHLFPMEVEFGKPQWVFGLSNYGFLLPNRIICAYNQRGIWNLATVDLTSDTLLEIEQPYDAISNVYCNESRVVFVGASPLEPSSLVELKTRDFQIEVLRKSSDSALDLEYISTAQTIEFPTESDRTAYAFYYPPKNPEYSPPGGEVPPLLVYCHGGPTGATSTALDLSVQFWTSRGFAVLDVNYGGSTGYGRAYRERLSGQWGVVDVDDCINGARFLVGKNVVDSSRTAIRGGSAGGFTTFASLTFRDFFNAGASYYGVSDIEVLAKETHKFESRYLETMVGSYPDDIELIRERSPINHLEKLSSPMIVFQGLEDKIVLPNQSEMMVDALRRKGLPVAYLPFEGEQHGFRRAGNIKRALEAELYFYGKIFAIEIADLIEPVNIENI
jgi:dipeptidyl aminopeptidase/acylaminoacyl peptidase